MPIDRGQRNHNPFNLMGTRIPWMGLADPPVDDGGYCVFIDDAHGLRAGFRDLYVAWEVDGLTTIAEMVPHFAPRSENNVPAYIADVCKFTGWSESDPLDLSNPANLQKYGTAFIHHENGGVIYTDPQLALAVKQALHNW